MVVGNQDVNMFFLRGHGPFSSFRFRISSSGCRLPDFAPNHMTTGRRCQSCFISLKREMFSPLDGRIIKSRYCSVERRCGARMLT